VTFAEWDACVAEAGCIFRPSDHGVGRGRRPGANVSWDDVTTQIQPWLSRKAGGVYRLLTEAEWEYAARAGTTTLTAFGDSITKSQALFAAPTAVEVGSFRPNAFGLYDMHGNEFEWVQDCWQQSYNGAPSDGSAWTKGQCQRRVLRSCSWICRATDEAPRSAARWPMDRDARGFGFRVARALVP
jgi:formylglycine-generating enzyme required for sulfatase activity